MVDRLKYLKKAEALGQEEVRDILLKARDKLDAKIIRAAKKSNFVSAAYARDNLYKQLEKEYVALNGDIEIWKAARSTAIAKEWRDFAIDDLPKGTYNQTWDQFDKKYMKDITERVAPSQGYKLAAVNSKLGGMLAQDIDFVRSSVIDVTRLASVTGMTAGQKTRAMRDKVLEERPGWNFIDSAGKTWDTDNYFKMLNKTVSAGVARSAYEDTMTEAGYDLARVVSHGGSSCEVCNKWNGKIVSVTGANKDYPKLSDAEDDGLFHPNCACYVAVVTKDELAALESNKTNVAAG